MRASTPLGVFAVLAGLAMPLGPAAASALFDKLIVFGDSLSDTGNVFAATGGLAPPSPAFYQGRFSNGPNWVDFLAEDLGVEVDLAPMPGTALDGSVNFAIGGTQSGPANPLPVPGGPTLPGALGQITGISPISMSIRRRCTSSGPVPTTTSCRRSSPSPSARSPKPSPSRMSGTPSRPSSTGSAG